MSILLFLFWWISKNFINTKHYTRAEAWESALLQQKQSKSVQGTKPIKQPT